MQPSFISFVWKFSARQQIYILFLTVLSFPLLYMTLELPKRIINDAVQATDFPTTLLGVSFEQIPYLLLLSFSYLALVLISGVLKMHTNTIKGITGERLLRRLRYQLIERITRFPLPYFRRTSQGALISMVISEVEAIGGMLGEAIARPTFAAGQMITILAFFFIQNFWLGLAAVAMIPIQAYIVPRLQRKINQLNKKRIFEVRQLSDQIGETVSGAEDLRVNGGVMFALAQFSKRFGRIFEIRLEIYQRKFFMKFLNNTLNQITPFLLLLIGGYLVINGQLTIGALTAALASYKDLLGPWRDLLSYYSQIQDASLRYRTITEQFRPAGMIDEALFFGRPDEIPRLSGPLKFDKVTINDSYGNPVISDIDLEIGAGEMVAVHSQNASARNALSQLISREVTPSAGQLTIADHRLDELHQAVIASRIGVVGPKTNLFHGGIEHNALMALWQTPQDDGRESDMKAISEARFTGNSIQSADVSWVDPSIAGFTTEEELRQWWAEIIRRSGAERFLLMRSLTNRMDTAKRVGLGEKLVALRPAIRKGLEAADLCKHIHLFDHDAFNPALTAIENVLFAVRAPDNEENRAMLDEASWRFMCEIGAEEPHTVMAQDILETLVQTFSAAGTDHPMFKRLAHVSPEMFEQLKTIHQKQERGETLDADERMLLLGLPFHITAEQLGSVFPDELREELLGGRLEFAEELQASVGDAYEVLHWDRYVGNLTMLENLVFGKIAQVNPQITEAIYRVVLDELAKAGLEADVLLLIGDVETGFAGSEIATVGYDRIAFVRATVKKPDVLVLERPFSNATPGIRESFHRSLRDLLPDTTILYLDNEKPDTLEFDRVLEIRDGRIVELGADGAEPAKIAPKTVKRGPAASDLNKKLRLLAQVDALEKLERSQLRLLAYAARWVKYEAGDYIFRRDDAPDGAYVMVDGEAQLLWPMEGEEPYLISTVQAGRMIGDMAVYMNQPRALDMRATKDMTALVIGNQALTDVINHDVTVAASLLKTVSGHLSNSANVIAALTRQIVDLGGKPQDFDRG
ncbi:ABC transporter transmembrane domain-containing protein [Oricola sp.]|uniref:ABC transporter transmembrane domain-containing protein n=1 Tax=Oricola sp. TaxID=1979950 RepID=UPI003BAA50C9